MQRTSLTVGLSLLLLGAAAARAAETASALAVDPRAYGAFATAVYAAENNEPEAAAVWLEKTLEYDPASAHAHVWLAVLYDEQLHQPAKAKEHFDSALKLDPRNFNARFGLARQLLRTGQADKGRAEMLLALELPEAKENKELASRAWTELGLNSELRREWNQAIEDYTRAAAVAPEPAHLFLRLSQVYQRLGRNDKAVDALRLVAQRVPAYARIHRELASLYAATGRWQLAYDELKAFIEHRNGPGEQTHLLKELSEMAERAGRLDLAKAVHERLLLNLLKNVPADKPPAALCEDIASALGSLGRRDEALPYLKKAIEGTEASAQPRLRLKLASLYSALKQPDKAVAELETCIQAVEPKASIRYRTELAAVLESAGKPDDARKTLEAILEIPGSKATGHAELATFLSRRGETDQAASHLLEAIKLADTDKSIRYRILLSMVYTEARRDKEAEQTLVEAQKMFPENSSLSNALGWFYAERATNLDKALELVQTAVKASPDNPYYLDSLGWVYYKQGKKKEALEQLERAASLGLDGAICDHLGDVYLDLGNRDKAREQWTRSLELTPQIKGVREKLDKLNKTPQQ